MRYGVLIVASGSGSRMGLGYNKVYAKLSTGKTILETTMDVFLDDPDCKEIIVVTKTEEFQTYIGTVSDQRVSVVEGGSTRQESSSHGLAAAKEEIVMIHDGARPYLERAQLEDLKKAMETASAALLCVPCKDTIKRVKDGKVVETPAREELMAAQTPQAFRKDLIVSCMEKALADGYTGTDDCSLVERYSDVQPVCVMGSYANIKITTIEDL